MILENNIDKLQNDLDDLDKKDRINAILNIANYVLPRLKPKMSEAKAEEITISFMEQPLFLDTN